jgi:hypothetical protein
LQQKIAPKLLVFKETSYEITLFKQEVPAGCQNIAGFFLKKFVGCSQIWLIPPVDHQIGGKKKKKNPEY